MNRIVLSEEVDVCDWFSPTFPHTSLSFDVETDGLPYPQMTLYGISFCDGKRACYINLYNNPNTDNIISRLKLILAKQELMIAHNAIYDMLVFNEYGLYFPTTTYYCTMVADHLLDETRPHGLKYLAQELLNHDTQHFEDVVKHGYTSKEFFQYALNDAVWTYELAIYQKSELIRLELMPLMKLECQFQHVLLEMHSSGVTVDLPRIEQTLQELYKAEVDLETQMLQTLGIPYQMQLQLDSNNMKVISRINFNSTQQLAEIIQKLGLPLSETTSLGAPSVGKKTIEKLKGQHVFIDLLIKYKIVRKLITAFFEPLPEKVHYGVIYPQFRDTGTKTGRLSCKNPNLQQLPKVNKNFPVDTRTCFIAPSGYKMIACDFSGQELRVLAHITKEPVLIDTFIKGKDLHLSTANDFFELGIPDDELYDNHPKIKEHKEKFYKERNDAKIVNFGMAYGKGSYGFSKDFGITEEEAQVILDKYFAALPLVKQAIQDCHKQVKEQGYVQTLFGRRRHFQKNEQGYYPNKAFRESFNFLIQGFSADMMRAAMVKVHQNKPMLWDLRCVGTVHDEAIYIVEEQYAEQAAKMIKACFEKSVKLGVPVVADVQIGNNYSECK